MSERNLKELILRGVPKLVLLKFGFAADVIEEECKKLAKESGWRGGLPKNSLHALISSYQSVIQTKNIFEKLDKEIIIFRLLEGIVQIVRLTLPKVDLNEMISVTPSMRTGYDKLVRAVMRVKEIPDLPLLIETELVKLLNIVKPEVSAKVLADMVWSHVLMRLHSGEWELYFTKTDIKLIDQTLDGLTPREQDIVRMYYGLPPYATSYNVQSISEKYGVTTNRIFQIKEKALRKLRTSFSKNGFEGLALPIPEKLKLYATRISELQKVAQKYAKIESLIMQIPLVQQLSTEVRTLRQKLGEYDVSNILLRNRDLEILDRSIDEFEMSVRLHSCLKNMSLLTLRDVIKCSERDFLNSRNFGKRTLAELKDLLEPYGLSLSAKPRFDT